MSGSILSLNSDVLDYILQHCSTSALIALSLVSSQLHPLTTRYLLHTVHLDRNPKQIFDFLNFVVDRTCQTKSSEILGPGSLTVRFTMVLAFQTFKPESGMFLPMKKEEYPVSAWAPLLTRALTLMPNLCSVVIGDLVEEICISSADFPSALLSRPRLTSLTLGNVGPTASRYFGQAMERMKDIPNFHIVDIGSDHGVFESALQITPHTGIGQALFRSSACLTEISLRGRIDLRGFVGNGHSETGDKKRITPVIFPNVVKLLISDRDVSLRGLATTFPALENLILRFLVVARDPSLDRPMQVTFSSLISIQGLCQNIAPFLEANADRERIRRIVIEGTWDRDEDEVTPFAILKATPYLKSLRFRQDPVRPLSWWEAFAQTIPHLTYLGLSLYTANRADVVVVCFHRIKVPSELIILDPVHPNTSKPSECSPYLCGIRFRRI